MCDFSKKLMAWMDGELPDGESADLERHVSACGECSNLLVSYKGASEAFDVYCEATFARKRGADRLAGCPPPLRLEWPRLL